LHEQSIRYVHSTATGCHIANSNLGPLALRHFLLKILPVKLVWFAVLSVLTVYYMFSQIVMEKTG
jgi:hypothetical protein